MKIGLTTDIETCHALRREVFINEQNVSEAEEIDGRDDDALHLLATDNDVPIGCARLFIEGNVCKIGRVCVLKSHRGTGAGAGLIRAALAECQSHPEVTDARLGAQIHALAFYEKLGFTAYGPDFDDAGIPHRMMSKPL